MDPNEYHDFKPDPTIPAHCAVCWQYEAWWQHKADAEDEPTLGAMTEDEKNELRLDQLDDAERGTPTGETIDITPVGMKTPEGNARVNKAMDEYSAATALVAELASELLESLDHNGNIPSDYRNDEYKRVRAAVKDRLEKQEELLRAVAGR